MDSLNRARILIEIGFYRSNHIVDSSTQPQSTESLHKAVILIEISPAKQRSSHSTAPSSQPQSMDSHHRAMIPIEVIPSKQPKRSSFEAATIDGFIVQGIDSHRSSHSAARLPCCQKQGGNLGRTRLGQSRLPGRRKQEVGGTTKQTRSEQTWPVQAARPSGTGWGEQKHQGRTRPGQSRLPGLRKRLEGLLSVDEGLYYASPGSHRGGYKNKSIQARHPIFFLDGKQHFFQCV